jgi:hypothetical protein
MFGITKTLERLTATLAVAVVLGGVAASQGFASGGSQYRDGWYGYAVALTRASQSRAATLLDGRSPDTRDFAQTAHLQSTTIVDGRSSDTRDFALAAQQQPTTAADGRSPDTRDFAALAHSAVVTITRSPGFEWSDFGIGVAAALGAMTMLALSARLLAARNDRKQPSPVATA